MTLRPLSALLILTKLGHLYLVINRTFLLGLDRNNISDKSKGCEQLLATF
jgi:hypothetical protein